MEEAESRRMEETDHQEHKPMIMRKYILIHLILILRTYYKHILYIFYNRLYYMSIAEPQLMLTAGPGMMAPGYAPQGVYGAPSQGVYAPTAAAYQAYGM